MSISRFICLILLSSTKFVIGFVHPESDGRSYFAVTIGNALKEHRQTRSSSETSFTISPAAVQKTFAILYNAAEDNDLLDFMLLEMGLKYYDAINLMETAMREMTSFDVLKEERLDKLDMPIERTDVLDYFKTDFIELVDQIYYENFITAPEDLEFTMEFIKFSKQFFNTTLLNEKESEKLANIYQKFHNEKLKMHSWNINLYSEVNFKANWKALFVDMNGFLKTHAEFLYGEITSSEDYHLVVQVLQLPLESLSDLSIFLITPKHGNELNFTTNYEVVRTLTNPAESANVLKSHIMEVKLPKVFKFQTKTNLSSYFRENGLTNAKIFGSPQPFKRMFTNLLKSGISIGHFKQHINLEINAKIVKELPTHHGGFLHNLKEKFIDLTKTQTFDITEKPFLFILKSEQTVYFMGHYYGNK